MDMQELAIKVNKTKRDNEFQKTVWMQNLPPVSMLELCMNLVYQICKMVENYRNNEIEGFEDPERGFRTIPESLMLVVTELGEAYEAHLYHTAPEFEEEIHDTLIRILDMSKDLDIHTRLIRGIIDKDIKNQKRGIRHGGKTA